MKLPSTHHRDRSISDVMTPMIDIVFLLLIFFVVAAAGQRRETVLANELAAPGSVEAEPPAERDPWVVEVWIRLTMEPGGTVVRVNDRVVPDIAALSAQLQALAELEPDTPVILDIAEDVPMQEVITVDDACRSAGFQSINFAARAAEMRSRPR